MDLLNKILSFLDKIGLQYHLETITSDTFLPGLKLRNGVLIIDTERLAPGDILHEAGHLATLPPEVRITMSDNLDDPIHQGGELMAIAWSYAVCIHLDIDPHIVFHEAGYKGGGKSIVENFSEGRFFGVPLMEWYGMTLDKTKAATLGEQPFPAMIEWVCKTKEQSIGEHAS